MTNLKTNYLDITHVQRKKIFALSKESNMSKDELYDYYQSWADVTSLSSGSCSLQQANKIIECLQAIINKRKTSSEFLSGGATEKQIKAIKTIQRILDWNDRRRDGFIFHTVEKRTIRDLTVPEASKVIIGLRKMLN